MVSAIYAALLALMQIGLTLNVVKYRRAQKVSLGTEKGDWELTRAVRAHGNFTEIVPMALFMLVLCDLQGAPVWFIHSLGMILIIGRVLHVIALLKFKYAYGWPRFVGMVLSLLVLLLGALMNLWLAVPGL